MPRQVKTDLERRVTCPVEMQKFAKVNVESWIPEQWLFVHTMHQVNYIYGTLLIIHVCCGPVDNAKTLQSRRLWV